MGRFELWWFHAPKDTGYVNVFSNSEAFAALKSNGSITAWGHPDYGGSNAPTDTGYVNVFSKWQAFAALKSDGSITAWGHSIYGGSNAPTNTGSMYFLLNMHLLH